MSTQYTDEFSYLHCGVKCTVDYSYLVAKKSEVILPFPLAFSFGLVKKHLFNREALTQIGDEKFCMRLNHIKPPI